MTRNLLLSALILFPLWTIAQPNPTIRSFRAEKLFLDGLTKFKQRQFYDAIETFDKVVELNTEHPKVYEARGDAYYQLKDYKNALVDYEEALKIDPDNSNLWNNAGVAAGDMYLYRAAAKYFYNAMQIDPDHKDASDNYQEALRLLDQEGIAYEEPRNNKPWDTKPWESNGDRPDRNNGSSSGDYDSSYGSDSGSGRDRNNGNYSSNSTRPGRYTPTRPGEKSNQNNNDYKDSPERSNVQEYLYKKPQLTVGPRTDIQLKVDQVRISRNSTMITFTVRNLGDKSFPVKLASRNSKEAWYLTDRSFERTYRLKSIKNLDGWNSGRSFNLKARGTKLFIAEFDRIDDDVFFFHLLEGRTTKPGAWNIYDIELNGKSGK